MNKLNEALETADLLHDRGTIERVITDMASAIRSDYAGSRPLVIVMMNGGLHFAAMLTLELGFDVQIDYLHATRYRGETSGGSLRWLRHPVVPLEGRRVLLLDDILDEGHTLAEVAVWCRGQGAAEVKSAVLVRKRHDRCLDEAFADYEGLEVPDRYVFGFGMDYYEQGRNLPAIYALAEEDGHA